jgi:hypothetical protein
MLPKVLLVKVEHDYIVVRVTGTSYRLNSSLSTFPRKAIIAPL